MVIYWEAVHADKSISRGTTSDGSWKALAEYVKVNQLPITSCYISNEKGRGVIDNNKDGYFIGNKVICSLTFKQEKHFVGLGYWTRSEDIARIVWYDAETMEVVETEARSTERCGFCLIKNPIPILSLESIALLKSLEPKENDPEITKDIIINGLK